MTWGSRSRPTPTAARHGRTPHRPYCIPKMSASPHSRCSRSFSDVSRRTAGRRCFHAEDRRWEPHPPDVLPQPAVPPTCPSTHAQQRRGRRCSEPRRDGDTRARSEHGPPRPHESYAGMVAGRKDQRVRGGLLLLLRASALTLRCAVGWAITTSPSPLDRIATGTHMHLERYRVWGPFFSVLRGGC